MFIIIDNIIFYNLEEKNELICEEIVKQHKDMAAFCEDTLNTCRLYTLKKKDGDVIVRAARLSDIRSYLRDGKECSRVLFMTNYGRVDTTIIING